MSARVVIDPALEAVVERYGAYQAQEKRMAELTVQMSSYGVRAFLAWRVRSGRAGLEEIDPLELSDYIIEKATVLKASSMRALVGTLRGFVRFLYATGETSTDLSAAVPAVPSSRLGGLPRAADALTVAALLASCDRSRPAGRRDFAVMTLMVRLGLRAVELSRLTLDDVDWRAGEITVRGKAGRLDRLPLPADVGEALADYVCYGRRPASCRQVFIQAQGPALPMSRNAVVFVSRTASVRAGIATVGAHRLRHTAATGMLRAGASLAEVGDVMRHNDEVTTSIYAKVDQSSLMRIVRCWPDGARP